MAGGGIRLEDGQTSWHEASDLGPYHLSPPFCVGVRTIGPYSHGGSGMFVCGCYHLGSTLGPHFVGTPAESGIRSQIRYIPTTECWAVNRHSWVLGTSGIETPFPGGRPK